MKQEINLTPTAPSRYHDYEATCWENGHEKGVEVGIAYQKEQDKELIEELLYIVKEYDKDMNGLNCQNRLNELGVIFSKSIKESISKTENYLKQ